MVNLSTIGKDAQRIAEAISAALRVDVEITDADLMRVAGTGEFSRQLGRSLAGQGCVHAHVLGTGATVVIENPGHHELCRSCVRAKQCYATAELCCPIFCKGAPAGVMGLVTRTRAQSERLLRNVDANVAFLERMADLLSAKMSAEEAMIRAHLRLQQLEAVIGAFDQGVLVVDEYGAITHANTYVLNLLRLARDGVVGRLLRDILTGTGLYDALTSGTELRYCRTSLRQPSGNSVEAMCNSYPVVVDGVTLGAVLVFQHMDDVSRLTYEVWEHENRTTSMMDMLGASPSLLAAKGLAHKVAGGNSTILLRGESGTGKGLMARAIHAESKRRDGPFVVVNCSAIPDTLLESELFGYEEGAFTGARKKGKLGRFELANKGTLFLDEIGDMPLHLQGKLLRALEDRVIEPVGGVESRPIDVRIIAATNRDLDSMVDAGEFRRDLFYRLNVVPIVMPPLKDRAEDIALLATFFLRKHNVTADKHISEFSKQALDRMLAYDWPGNVRELSNSIEYAVNVESESVIHMHSLPQRILGRTRSATELGAPPVPAMAAPASPLDDIEYRAIIEALNRHAGSPGAKEKAAAELGIHVTTLYRKLKKHALP